MFSIILLVYKIGLVLRITDIAAKGCFGCGFKSQNSKKKIGKKPGLDSFSPRVGPNG